MRPKMRAEMQGVPNLHFDKATVQAAVIGRLQKGVASGKSGPASPSQHELPTSHGFKTRARHLMPQPPWPLNRNERASNYRRNAFICWTRVDTPKDGTAPQVGLLGYRRPQEHDPEPAAINWRRRQRGRWQAPHDYASPIMPT